MAVAVAEAEAEAEAVAAVEHECQGCHLPNKAHRTGCGRVKGRCMHL